MFEYQILYWRDIPAQIKVFAGKRPKSHQLSARFQTWIDRIAMEEGIIGSDEYLDLWQWSDKKERASDLEDGLPALIEEIEAEGNRVIDSFKSS